jgi:hypothetical protein
VACSVRDKDQSGTSKVQLKALKVMSLDKQLMLGAAPGDTLSRLCNLSNHPASKVPFWVHKYCA